MNYLIISGNPKSEGLCYSVTEEIASGAKDGGADVEIITTEDIERCRVCGDGWGTCRAEHKCQYGGEAFSSIQQKIKQADQICIITPVYWGEVSEGLKSLLDKLRRCEFGQGGALSKKQILLIASPGGTGNGMLTCMEQMDRFCRSVGAIIFDYIGINRWNSDYKRKAAHEAAKAMAQGRQSGETV